MELYPGIHVLEFRPGHDAYGMMGLLVTLPGSGNYISDRTLSILHELWSSMQYRGLAYDTRGFERTIDRIRKLETGIMPRFSSAMI